MTSESKIRIFIAFRVDRTITKLANETIRHLKDAYRKEFRAVEPSGFHITLIYLGDIEHGLMLSINKEITDICDRHPPIRFSVKGLGVFPNWSNPSVLWLRAIDPKRKMESLRKDIVKAIRNFDFQKTDSIFRPHITLGRFRRKPKAADIYELENIAALLEQNELLSCMATNLFVLESTPTSRGVLYRPISEFNLTG
ncbi:MAG: RNA 2',3'-cyclic phosphodiesterase [SAR202 cluster bacterium]|uniref:Phosphoesterase HXTX domain-containing protein n=1 Tax=marine metagenome TaxID=408172 RepID=A0A382Y209_9ZZZZ|nr:RNA 2',3'-cyclic phosphodiesterase [SAR202 cluster bacterium]